MLEKSILESWVVRALIPGDVALVPEIGPAVVEGGSVAGEVVF